MLHRLRSSDDGFTLVELLVVMLITGIVLAMIGTLFANIARITSWSGRDRDRAGQSALALDAIRAVVRVAADNPTSPTVTDPAVLDAKDSTLTLTAYSNTDASSATPVKVTFLLDANGYLVQRRFTAIPVEGGYWSYASGYSQTRVAGPFVNPPATPFFTYISTTNALLTGGTSGLSLAQRKTVALIRVTALTDGTDSAGRSGTDSVTSSIGMPNLSQAVVSSLSIPTIPPPTQTPSLTPPPSAPSTPAPTTTAPSASPSPTGSGSGTGSGTGTGTGTATPGTGGSGGSGTPAPTGGTGGGSSTPTATSTPSPSTTPTPTPTPTPTKPVVFQ